MNKLASDIVGILKPKFIYASHGDELEAKCWELRKEQFLKTGNFCIPIVYVSNTLAVAEIYVECQTSLLIKEKENE